MEQQMDAGHGETRSVLRVVGPLMAAGGGLLILIGMVSFFAAFSSHRPPRLFWCIFLGMPIFATGMALTKFAYMGRIARFAANELAPVGTDTFNYVAHGTQGAVRDLASAVGEGLAASGSRTLVRCHKCNAENDLDASFCKGCGAALVKAVECSACAELNDADARYCDNCGKSLA